MKILCIRYPRNAVTDILVSFLCLFIIVLILQNGEVADTSYKNYGSELVSDYLSSHGWDINSEDICETSVLLPDEFSSSMNDYFQLQLEQGFDLTDYAGKVISRYDTEILNYPDNTVKDVFASVYVYENKIIASDIHSVSINGFMHGVETDELDQA